MRTLLSAAAFAMVISPGIGTACDYGDEASASTAPPEQVAASPVPAAAKTAPKVAKAGPSTAKQTASKTKASTDTKVAAAPAN